MTQLPSNFTAKTGINSPRTAARGGIGCSGRAGGGVWLGDRGVKKGSANEGGDGVTSSGLHVKITMTFGACLSQLAQGVEKNNIIMSQEVGPLGRLPSRKPTGKRLVELTHTWQITVRQEPFLNRPAKNKRIPGRLWALG